MLALTNQTSKPNRKFANWFWVYFHVVTYICISYTVLTSRAAHESWFWIPAPDSSIIVIIQPGARFQEIKLILDAMHLSILVR